ncbi:MAG: PTS sugar transporter subunit IIA [Verrucomicrobia bacterium]|nr:PTS sugar transporter subunit IIA [Verrucomicrobiota bacterium]
MNLESSPFFLTDLLRNGGIKLRLTGTRRDDVLEELVGLIPELSGNAEARSTLLRALKEREQLHSTSIGDGVAIPHARNALVGLVQRPVMVFGRHQEGINFGALDGDSTKLFFLIISPTVTQHLAVLARLSRLLRNPILRKHLLIADKNEKALSLIQEAEANAQFRPAPTHSI